MIYEIIITAIVTAIGSALVTHFIKPEKKKSVSISDLLSSHKHCSDKVEINSFTNELEDESGDDAKFANIYKEDRLVVVSEPSNRQVLLIPMFILATGYIAFSTYSHIMKELNVVKAELTATTREILLDEMKMHLANGYITSGDYEKVSQDHHRYANSLHGNGTESDFFKRVLNLEIISADEIESRTRLLSRPQISNLINELIKSNEYKLINKLSVDTNGKLKYCYSCEITNTNK